MYVGALGDLTEQYFEKWHLSSTSSPALSGSRGRLVYFSPQLPTSGQEQGSFRGAASGHSKFTSDKSSKTISFSIAHTKTKHVRMEEGMYLFRGVACMVTISRLFCIEKLTV